MKERMRLFSLLFVCLFSFSLFAISPIPTTMKNRSIGTGDVVGPATATENSLAQFVDITGKLIKSTPYTVPLTVGPDKTVLVSDGTNLSFARSPNMYVVPAAFDLDWSSGHLFHKDISADASFTYSGKNNGDLIILSVNNTAVGNVKVTLPYDAFTGGPFIVSVPPGPVLFTIIRTNGLDFVASTIGGGSGGSGDVVGPGTSTADWLPMFADGTGKLLKQSNLFHDNAAGALWVMGMGTPEGFNPSISVSKGNSQGAFGQFMYNGISFTGKTSGGFSLKAPDVGVWSNLTMPATAPTANQILQSDATGQLSWINTPVESTATGDVMGPASSNQGEFATFDNTTGKLIKNMGNITVDGMSGANTGVHVAGSFTAGPAGYSRGATVDGPNATVTVGASDYVNGSFKLVSSFAPGNSVRLSLNGAAQTQYVLLFPNVAPAANQSLVSDASGQFTWATLGNVVGPVSSTDNAVAKFDLATGKIIHNSGVIISDTNDISGVGDLRTTGDIVSAAFNMAAGVSINYSTAGVGNNAYTTASCGAITLSGMADGGVYALAIKGTAQTTSGCVFTYAGVTLHYPVGHGVTTAGKQTLYTFMRLGDDIYIGWSPGL